MSGCAAFLSRHAYQVFETTAAPKPRRGPRAG